MTGGASCARQFLTDVDYTNVMHPINSEYSQDDNEIQYFGFVSEFGNTKVASAKAGNVEKGWYLKSTKCKTGWWDYCDYTTPLGKAVCASMDVKGRYQRANDNALITSETSPSGCN